MGGLDYLDDETLNHLLAAGLDLDDRDSLPAQLRRARAAGLLAHDHGWADEADSAHDGPQRAADVERRPEAPITSEERLRIIATSDVADSFLDNREQGADNCNNAGGGQDVDDPAPPPAAQWDNHDLEFLPDDGFDGFGFPPMPWDNPPREEPQERPVARERHFARERRMVRWGRRAREAGVEREGNLAREIRQRLAGRGWRRAPLEPAEQREPPRPVAQIPQLPPPEEAMPVDPEGERQRQLDLERELDIARQLELAENLDPAMFLEREWEPGPELESPPRPPPEPEPEPERQPEPQAQPPPPPPPEPARQQELVVPAPRAVRTPPPLCFMGDAIDERGPTPPGANAREFSITQVIEGGVRRYVINRDMTCGHGFDMQWHTIPTAEVGNLVCPICEREGGAEREMGGGQALVRCSTCRVRTCAWHRRTRFGLDFYAARDMVRMLEGQSTWEREPGRRERRGEGRRERRREEERRKRRRQEEEEEEAEEEERQEEERRRERHRREGRWREERRPAERWRRREEEEEEEEDSEEEERRERKAERRKRREEDRRREERRREQQATLRILYPFARHRSNKRKKK
ncbi:hypothetical protein SAPIO_CDS5473 [Scedosporium apiospermum]|uniref:Uncharacterized protein n=1 Tax=Pseudallescheria apiosperma TaxID=563466 RepID=A0A084G4Q1_PSEDA|nr:uncharacterized protein SAPIO_CDS5473 [Scedosporium apiospermum]KEZ42313.1 hypothetical protein SAPIO_CDS5473 [Scedosporium apiospermum]